MHKSYGQASAGARSVNNLRCPCLTKRQMPNHTIKQSKHKPNKELPKNAQEQSKMAQNNLKMAQINPKSSQKLKNGVGRAGTPFLGFWLDFGLF